MEIKQDYKKMMCMSPWGFRHRPFTESRTNNSDFSVPLGSTLPDVVRAYYGNIPVHPIQLAAGFMSRDLFKEKSYDPGTEDPFVMKDTSSMHLFFKSSRTQVKTLTQLAEQLGVPMKKDKDRTNEMIIDQDALFEWLNPNHEKHQVLLDNWSDLSFIASNQDITRKFCIVRAVPMGWWASSYAGKPSGQTDTFNDAVEALVEACKILKKSPAFDSAFAATEPDIGDPLDTNVGYPLYEGQMDKEGRPVSKLRIADIYANMGVQFTDFDGLRTEIDSRCPNPNLKGFPLAMAPLRRQQSNYKPAHMFNVSTLGLSSSNDWYGFNTVRIAWMAPYLQNLYLSPIQLEWKVLRKIIPGLFHDGDAKKRRNDLLKSKGDTIKLAEADYSNYDRFIPFDIFERFCELYFKDHKREKLIMSMIKGLFHNVPIIWPDSINGDGKHGWIFNPPDLGLFSGLKITSEVGTFVNAIVNLKALQDTYGWNKQQLVEYLTMYKDSPSGSKLEKFWVMSDDTLLIAESPGVLYKHGQAFKKYANLAGLKGSLQLGDRFLMRHCNEGRDTPVPARVFQNTISNESPVEDALIFRVGLATRTEGMLGQRTFDPFSIGKLIKVSASELEYSQLVIEQLLEQVSTAKARDARSIKFLELLAVAARQMALDKGTSKFAIMRKTTSDMLDVLRKEFIQELADRELVSILEQKVSKGFSTLIYQLYKDRHNPASNRILTEIIEMSGHNDSFQRRIATNERTLYKFIMHKINIPLNINQW